MKKTKLLLLAAAFCGISLAWTNRSAKRPFTIHTYAYLNLSPDGSKYYYSRDITASGFSKGNQYVCIAAIHNCSFYADPGLSHTDFTGNYFWVWDVPNYNIDNSGVYYEF